MCNELDTWSNYPILPSRSVNLTTVVHRLCKTLEHHYEVELTSQEKYKKSIGVELEYEARRLCSGEQRNCSEESVKVQLKLKVREHNPWVFRQLSCLDRNQSVNFNMRESFAQRKPTNNRKFSLNTTLIHIRLCRMANSSIIDRTFEAFSQYFAEDCFSPLKNLDTKLQLLNVSIDGSKLTVSFDKEKLCNSVEESFWKEDTQSVATLFVELAFRRNAGSSNLEQVLLLAVYKSVIPKSTRSIVVTSSFPAMRAELATTTSTKSIRRTFPTSSSTRHAEITTSTKSTTEPVPTSSSTRRAETTTSTETTTTTKAVLISSPSTGTKLTTSSESYISTRIKDSAARHDEITTKSVFSSLTASVETEPTRSIVSLLPNDYLAYPENAFDDKVTEKEPHWIEQDTESEVLDSRDTILLGQVPENKKKVEVGSTPDGRTEQWAVLSICAIAVVVFLVLFGAAHYVYSLLAWEREPNDKETYSGQLLDETVPIYVDPAYLRMETIDVNAVVDQAIKTYEISNYYAPQASENVVMLDPQFSGERIRKKDASLRSQRHVSFLADYSKKQHSTTKNKFKTGAVHPN